MSGRTLPFFPRQTLVSETAMTTTVIYSDPFETSQYPQLVAQLSVYGLIGTNPTLDAAILYSDSLSLVETEWDADTSFTQVSSAPTMERKTATNPPGRYTRIRITLTAASKDAAATFEVTGVARASS